MNAFTSPPAPSLETFLSGSPMCFSMMARIGARQAVVRADAAGLDRVASAYEDVEAAIRAGVPVYGATTGVGAMKDLMLSPDDINAFNAGLVRAHSFGTGDPFPLDVVRIAMAIRVNTALTGNVGCSVDLVEAFLRLLATDVVPVVRRTGSIGCADIGLMGQIGAVLTGAGEAFFEGRRVPASVALEAAGLAPVQMHRRDSLASFGVNAVAYAAAARALRRACGTIRIMMATSLASAAAMGTSRDPWEAAIEIGTPREAEVGRWLVEGSRRAGLPIATHIQDPLSLRMMTQVFAVVLDGLHAAGRIVEAATGRCDDNPVMANGRVLTSGGSIPLDVTIAMQSTGIALAHAARNAFNRCVLIANGSRRTLPVNLVSPSAIATGFGPIVKLAGDLFVRVLTLSQPISPQSLVVAAGIEDEAAFLPLVVERFERQTEAILRLSALETLLAAQAMDVMGDRPRGIVGEIYATARRHAAFYDEDRPLSAEVEAIEEEIASEAAMGSLLTGAPMPEIDAFFALNPALS